MATTTTKASVAAGVVLGAGAVAFLTLTTAALRDNFGAARLASASIECPDDDEGACRVTWTRVRPMKADVKAEAQAEGLSTDGARERVRTGTVTRAELRAFLNNRVVEDPAPPVTP